MGNNIPENDDSKFGISMEIEIGDPLNEEELDQLALLFAKAIVRKMLSKGNGNVRKDTTSTKSNKL